MMLLIDRWFGEVVVLSDLDRNGFVYFDVYTILP